MSIAIRAEHVSKLYRLGVINHGMLYKDMQSYLARKFGRPDPHAKIGKEFHDDGVDHYWALKDVSFEIEKGDRVGIIGKNGAGKSTLLKILSRITAPTEGKIKVKGRIASLLEVGTGFHPELTGRENIFLNGAILGMKRAQIAKKLDAIIDFSEIEKYIDTPVKRYSSGMYVRLAFAVAAHLDSDILLADEVLAVGDAAFQKKCLGKMEDVSKNQGRTVLFVSHNLSAVSSLCEKSILLSLGHLETEGRTTDVIMKYYSGNENAAASFIDFSKGKKKLGNEYVTLLSSSIEDTMGNTVRERTIYESFRIRMRYSINKESEARFVPNFHFYTGDGICAFVVNAPGVEIMKSGVYDVLCEVPPFVMNEGLYKIGLAITAYRLTSMDVAFFENGALSVNIIDPMEDASNRYGYTGPIPGVLRPSMNWSIKAVEE